MEGAVVYVEKVHYSLEFDLKGNLVVFNENRNDARLFWIQKRFDNVSYLCHDLIDEDFLMLDLVAVTSDKRHLNLTGIPGEKRHFKMYEVIEFMGSKDHFEGKSLHLFPLVPYHVFSSVFEARAMLLGIESR